MSKEIPTGVALRAKTNGPLVIYEPERDGQPTGSVCIAIPITAVIDEASNWSGKTTMALINKDGAPNSISLESLKKIFGLGSLEEVLDLPNLDVAKIEFDIVLDYESYTNPETGATRDVLKVKYMNPVGESGGRMPAAGDVDAIKRRYAAKIRALSGGRSVKPAAAPTKAPAKAPAKPAAKLPPSKGKKAADTEPCTQEDAWAACQAANPEQEDASELAEKVWYPKIEELFPGKSQGDLDEDEWGAVKAAFEN
jgi:hypothetical protein